MKRLLIFCALSVFVFATLVSCTKDTSTSIKGTKWVGNVPASSSLPALTVNLSFHQTDFEMMITAVGEEGYMKMFGDYTYIPPEVELHATTSLDSDGTVISQKGVSYSGAVQDNHMTIIMGSAIVNFTLR